MGSVCVQRERGMSVFLGIGLCFFNTLYTKGIARTQDGVCVTMLLFNPSCISTFEIHECVYANIWKKQIYQRTLTQKYTSIQVNYNSSLGARKYCT